jgi:transposase
MARAYSPDLRARVLRACEAGGESQASIARRFEVSEGCVSMWLKAAREEGRREAKAHGGGPILLASDLPVLGKRPGNALQADSAKFHGMS